MAHDVFISYSKSDKRTADGACAALEAAGIRCWIAPRDVAPGVSWPAAIIDAIGRSHVMVLVFSSHALASKEVQREVINAFQNRVVVVPLRIEDVRPSGELAYYMCTTHWLDALTPPLEAHLQRLCTTIKALVPRTSKNRDAKPVAVQSRAEPPPLAPRGRSPVPARKQALDARSRRAPWEIIKGAAKRPRIALSSAIAVALAVCLTLVWSLTPPASLPNREAQDGNSSSPDPLVTEETNSDRGVTDQRNAAATLGSDRTGAAGGGAAQMRPDKRSAQSPWAFKPPHPEPGPKLTQVRFVQPAGMQIGWQIPGFAEHQKTAPDSSNFAQGVTYRLKLTHIPGREGITVYPTLQVYAAAPTTEPFLFRDAVPIEITDEDLDQVESDKSVTKVIYLPNPGYPTVTGAETLVSTHLDLGVNPVDEASRRGTILAVFRMFEMTSETK
jgi:TIR domain